MENVVYILGAGFSQPFGLPTISNFFDKAYELFFSNDEKYQFFDEVLETIKRMSYIKNYYSSNLFNIEEALSIYEMSKQANKSTEHIRIHDFIIDVIKHYTPPMKNINYSSYTGRTQEKLEEKPYFGNDQIMQAYTLFVHSLLNIRTTPFSHPDIKFREVKVSHRMEPNFETNYSVITLNYDNILERIADCIDKHKVNDSTLIKFKKFSTSETQRSGGVPLCKLHGCIDSGKIIPPTWNKSIDDNVREDWEQAFQSLSQAHHLRIIGFSLPETDSYFKYLLKAAVLKAKHLKSLDVICLDPDGSAQRRYESFITYDKMRFVKANTMSYLGRLIYNVKQTESLVSEVLLERLHKSFMEKFYIYKAI